MLAMKTRFAVVFFALPLAAWAGGCSGASGGGGLSCPADPQCYVVSATGECSVDLGATCSGSTWQCSANGKLGSGCYPDGGIVPPDDAGACPLAQLNPPLACNDDSTCTPYGGHCVFDALNGPGTCVCGSPVQQDAGADSDACVLDCYGDYCGLPSFTVACNGPGDTTTCSQYAASCAAAPAGQNPPYECVCQATDPPHNAP
jgi:hypothetical protein